MLIWVFTAAAVLCLVYYGVIVLYAGFGTSFAVLWLLIGGFFGATAAGIHFYQKYPERVPLWLPVSFVTLCASGLMIVLVTQILWAHPGGRGAFAGLCDCAGCQSETGRKLKQNLKAPAGQGAGVYEGKSGDHAGAFRCKRGCGAVL